MQTNPIVVVFALTITAATYYLMRDPTLPSHEETAKPSHSAPARLTVTKPPTSAVRRAHSAPPEQQQMIRMTKQIAALEARLRSLEATTSEPAPPSPVPSQDEPAALEETEPAKTQQLSEEAFGQWMDAALETGDFDREETQLTMEQMETSLAAVPGLNLADLQCSAFFCRANFGSDDGTPPNVLSLFGTSPFIESGFTLPTPDGGVSVYFTQPGQSLSELRSEAQEQS